MIRQCSEKEALSILNEKEISERVGLIAEELKQEPWIVEIGNHKMLFFFWSIGGAVYEMHIACPRKSIAMSRKLSYFALIYVLSFYAKKVVTNCPEGKISNMAKKLGLRQINQIGVQIFYEVSLWQLERQ